MKTADVQRRRSRRLAAAAGWLMAVQGVLHTVVLHAAARHQLDGWVHQRVWDEPIAVPIEPGDMTQHAAHFWASTGSFGIPVVLLGGLVVWLSRRGVRLPAALGWGYGVWGVVSALIAGPATAFATALIPAGLLIAAARPAATQGRKPTETVAA